MASVESSFMRRNVPRLLKKYAISFCREEDCIEYFITDRISNEPISCALVLSLNRRAGEIHVSRFYPELYKQEESKYLSAVCFYLLIHHFADSYHLKSGYNISLDTRPATFENFFARLKDFHFRLKRLNFCQTAQILSDYEPLDIDTSMIEEMVLKDTDILFLH